MYGKKIVGLGAVSGKYSKKDMDLIYKHTPKEYRSIVNGVKYVLYGSDKVGTVLAPVKNLPKMTFNAKLRQAKFREKK